MYYIIPVHHLLALAYCERTKFEQIVFNNCFFEQFFVRIIFLLLFCLYWYNNIGVCKNYCIYYILWLPKEKVNNRINNSYPLFLRVAVATLIFFNIIGMLFTGLIIKLSCLRRWHTCNTKFIVYISLIPFLWKTKLHIVLSLKHLLTAVHFLLALQFIV